MTTENNENTQPANLTVDDMDTFFMLLASWHSSKVAMLKHMLTIPEGTEVAISGDGENTMTLIGDTLTGFRLGIELSLMELGTLPFYPEVDETDEVHSVTEPTKDH